MNRWKKTYRELTLADDFMFTEIMSQERFCKPFLENLLNKKISRIKIYDRQKDCTDTYDKHGIRMDVYLVGEDDIRYNIEMQTTTQRELPKRIRYYQGGMDRYTLNKNQDYRDLADTYIIFICIDDYYGRGLALYERENHIKDAPDIEYQDGSHVFILNCQFTDPNADPKTVDFLGYLKARYFGEPYDVSGSQYLKELDEAVETAKLDEEKERAYMSWTMKLRDAQEEARKEGIEQGIEQGIEMGSIKKTRNVVRQMLLLGADFDFICAAVQEPANTVQAIVDMIKAEQTAR